MKTKLFFIALLAVPLTLLANPPVGATSVEKTFGHYMSFGGVLFDTGPMQDELSAAGFATPRDWAYQFGGGMYVRNRMVFEAALSGLMWKPKVSGDNKTMMMGVTSSLNAGVNLLPLNLPVAVYPMIGGGFGRTWLTLNQEKADFDDAVATPMTDLTLSKKSFVLRAALGADWMVTRPGDNPKSLTIGMRGGYLFDLKDGNDWSANRVEVRKGPDMPQTGWFGQLTIGKSIKAPWKHEKGKCCGQGPKA